MHALFESLGYATGFLVYRRARARRGDVLAEHTRWSVIAAAAVGALLGSRVLGLLEQAPRLHMDARALLTAMLLPGGGKTIVGGLLGGWIAVEIVKQLQGVRARTGDLFAIPLCVGIAVGRIGCLLAGLADDTYGKATRLPWAVNFGDGVPRHPTQAYEILFLVALACVLRWTARKTKPRPYANGTLFRVFLAAYLAWRLVIDLLKPQPLVAGLNLIQWACIAGLLALAVTAVLDRSGDPVGVNVDDVSAAPERDAA